MLLNIITGGIGTGKSNMLYSLINENLRNNPSYNAILLVPEQFSYTADKTLNEIAGGQGPNRIEVLTFSRLISRYIDLSGDLMPSGKIMLVLKAMSDLSEDNMYISSAKRTGFVSACAELFSEFRRYLITPEDLLNLTPENTVTLSKLRSLGEIYENYTGYFGKDFTDSDDAFSFFADYIRETDIFANTVFFIDDYSDFLPQHYRLISALIENSRGVHISLGIGEDEDFFAPVINARSRLIAIAKSMDAQVYSKHLTGEPSYINSEELRFLMNNWNSHNEYDKKTHDIEIFTSRDPYSEVEHTAGKIISLVRDEGFRFRDIGIVCGDMDRYLHLAGAIFGDYNIPYFADEKIPVSMHPVAQTVLSVFDILNENWSYQSVFAYLRGGYIYDKSSTPINQEDIDLLENYVLKYGIKGKKAWFSDFTKGGETIFDEVIDSHTHDTFDLDFLNSIRKNIITPFEKFLENKSRTVSKIAEALFEFLQDINLYNGILKECEKFDSEGRRDESEQFKKVWNCILEVLDQVVIASGSDIISRENFANYIKCGLSQCSISIIPSGLDRVAFGTVQKNSPSRVKALFIIGANRGAIPAEPSGGSIITDSDRIFINTSLADTGKEIAPDDTGRLFLENLKLYRIVSAATDRLYISYPVIDEAGNDMTPSEFVIDMMSKFPGISVKDNIVSAADNAELLSSQKRGFYYMLHKLGEYYKDNPEKLWQEVRKWYEARPEYKDKIEFLDAAAEYRRLKPKLSLEKAALLYGKNKKYSITALEKFSQCPFAYYMSRGLYARPRQTLEVQKSHLGSLIHYAVCEYCKQIENGAKTVSEIRTNWETLTAEKSAGIINNIMVKVREKVLPQSDETRPRLEYLLKRCEKTLKSSAERIRKSVQGGEYAVVACEQEFETTINWKNDSVTLIGTIDRIDVMELENRANVRIVDYKSGTKKFSTTAIANKLDMQLVLYAQAALDMFKNGDLAAVNQELDPKITAIFYNKINEDVVTLPHNSEALAAEKIKKEEKLDGLIILDGDEENLSRDTIYEMDRDFESRSTSDYLNVALTQKDAFNNYSQIIPRQNFDIISDYLKKTVISIDRSIKSGDISISPYKKGSESACQYCDYKQICMFDNDINVPRIGCSGNDDPIEIMKKAVTEDE